MDAANVMGSRPNGWWRDRAKAAAGLCGEIRDAVRAGRLTGPVVVILEGAARPGVSERDEGELRIVHAPSGGDDTIAAVATDASATGHTVTVVTADRELRARVEQVGCEVVGPRWLLDRL